MSEPFRLIDSCDSTGGSVEFEAIKDRGIKASTTINGVEIVAIEADQRWAEIRLREKISQMLLEGTIQTDRS